MEMDVRVLSQPAVVLRLVRGVVVEHDVQLCPVGIPGDNGIHEVEKLDAHIPPQAAQRFRSMARTDSAVVRSLLMPVRRGTNSADGMPISGH
jgi:hypothetical protein